MMNLDFLHVEQYEIFNTTFNGIFERTAYDVWSSWYIYGDATVIYKVTIIAIILSVISIGVIKALAGMSAIKYAKAGNLTLTIVSALACWKTGYLVQFIYLIYWFMFIFGYTIYYMMGYTL